jgi:hypothetical protein
MPDPVLELRESDPAAQARTAPPRDVFERIVATPLQAPRPPRRRAPRIALGAAALAAAAVVAFAALPAGDNAPGPIRASLAERAFAATAPQPEFITYTETTTVQTGNPRTESYDKLRQWQYGDRMHNFMETRQPRGEWLYEHDQDGATFRTLMNNDKGGTEVQVTKKTDPGWNQEELEAGFKVGVTTLVERFREAIPGAEDLGETTFNGKRAHAYGVKRSSQRVPPGDTVYYVDPETAEPLGSKTTITTYEPKVVDGKPVQGEPTQAITSTTTVDRYDHLEPTPENLKLLDAPNIDAAQRKR